MSDIISLIKDLEPKAREKILGLCSSHIDEKELFEYKNRSIGISIANAFLELEKPAIAKELFIRYEDYFGAAKTAKAPRLDEEAKEYIKKYILEKKFGMLDGFDSLAANMYSFDDVLLESRGIFTKSELEDMLDKAKGLADDKDVRDAKNLMLIEAFVAKELGQEDKISGIYGKLKKEIDEISDMSDKALKRDDMESVENLCYDRISSYDYLAKLCIVIGKIDEALEIYFTSDFNQRKIFDSPFSDCIKNLNLKEYGSTYEFIINRALHDSSQPDYYTAAKAAEILGEKEMAEKCYKKALADCEGRLSLSRALKIAKQLNLKEKSETYAAIADYLYENKFV